MSLLVPAHPGSPRQRAVKWQCCGVGRLCTGIREEVINFGRSQLGLEVRVSRYCSST